MVDMTLKAWAIRHGVTPAALAELEQQLGIEWRKVATSPEPSADKPGSEARVTSLVRLEAARKGWQLWRNNVGQLLDDRGVPVRYGIANESKQMNTVFKSSDYIGMRPVVITAAMVGHTIGQFAALEMKKTDWVYCGDAHETAQLNYINLVNLNGGYAKFVNNEGTL